VDEALLGLRLADLVDLGRLSPLGLALALHLASAWGATHAFSPGHGKTLVAAYLVGSRGTARHALYLGLTVTATHTLGVYALGLVALFATRYVLPEQLYPWLSLAAGLSVVLVGGTLLVRRARETFGAGPGRRPVGHGHETAKPRPRQVATELVARAEPTRADLHEHDHVHPHDHSHEHLHEHLHPHEHSPGAGLAHHGHSHLPPTAGGVTWRGLLALGVAGGLLPCPSALILLLGTIAVGQVAYGLVLVLAFSLGLAATLTALGVAVVYAGHVLASRQLPRLGQSERLRRLALLLSALLIAVLGLTMTVDALAKTGLLRL
jgi:ABC-type nickel/cobalt efflux system permease component RcnA